MPGQYLHVVTTISFQTPANSSFIKHFTNNAIQSHILIESCGEEKHQIVIIFTVQYIHSPTYSIKMLK